MSYKMFVKRVSISGWTVEQIRFDVPPTPELMAFVEEVGPDYERFALRFAKANP